VKPFAARRAHRPPSTLNRPRVLAGGSLGLPGSSSYQVAEHVRDGRLQIVLRSDEYAPLPVHIVAPEGRLSVPKVRAFVDFAVPRLRAQFTRLTADAGA
jgi:DNA-binding transcriptional LysR family regulator